MSKRTDLLRGNAPSRALIYFKWTIAARVSKRGFVSPAGHEAGSFGCARGRPHSRQVNGHLGALSNLAADIDRATGLMNKAVDLRQAKSCPFADLLRREERIKNPRQDIRGYPHAGVAHGERNKISLQVLAVVTATKKDLTCEFKAVDALTPGATPIPLKAFRVVDGVPALQVV